MDKDIQTNICIAGWGISLSIHQIKTAAVKAAVAFMRNA
jgi:hypothetical protein